MCPHPPKVALSAVLVSVAISRPFGPLLTVHAPVPLAPTLSLMITESVAARIDPYVHRDVPKSHTHGKAPNVSGRLTARSRMACVGSSTDACIFTHDLLFGISRVSA